MIRMDLSKKANSGIGKGILLLFLLLAMLCLSAAALADELTYNKSEIAHGEATVEGTIEGISTLENGNNTWTWYTGLGGEGQGETGLASETGIIQLRIPESAWVGAEVGAPLWTITNNHDSEAGIYEFSLEEEYDSDGRGVCLKPTWTEETVTGMNTYTVQAEYNGKTFTSTETVRFMWDSYPTGMTMTVQEVDLNDNTVVAEIPFEDGAFTIQAGRDYVFTCEFEGTAPQTGSSVFMNGWLEGGTEYGRYDDRFRNPDGSFVWSDNQQVFAAETPGTYHFHPSLIIGMSNLTVRGIYTIRIADEEGNVPEEVTELIITADYQQRPVPAGEDAVLNWAVIGGTAPYDVEVAWRVDCGCLMKTMQTDTFSDISAEDASGAASFRVPMYADQLNVTVTVTDANENRYTQDVWTAVENWERAGEASYSVRNDMDYAYVGEPVSASWSINAGSHTISNVRYQWVTVYREDGEEREITTDWTDAGDALTGSSTYITTHTGVTWLSVAFDAEDGWSCPGGAFDRIQVLNPGETPLTAEVTISPETPVVGDTITLAWEVSGATDSTRINLFWGAHLEDGFDSENNEEEAALQGTRQVIASSAGDVFISLHVWDEDSGVEFNREQRVHVEEPSGIALTVSPEHPRLGEPVTVSWEITRDHYQDAGLYGKLRIGDLTKRIDQETLGADLMNSRAGSVQYTPEEGETICFTAYLGTDTGWYEESTEEIALEGDWTAPDPIQVTVTYSPAAAQVGDTITAVYQVTGGDRTEEDYNTIFAQWVRMDENGEVILHGCYPEAGGTLSYVPSFPGRYGVIFLISDRDGWELEQRPEELTDYVTVEGSAVMQPLGIALKKALPERIDLEEGFELAWDVTGGDADEMRETQVHIETDDGIVIADDTAWGYSNYWRFDAHGEDVSGSRYVIITLTPRDSSSTGDPFTEQIQLAQQETGGTLVLPRGLTTIEEEAFLYVAASEFDIPDGVSFIGQNAFPNNATLIVGSDSYAKTWAEENGYAYTVR